ncbi:Meiotically up-regulated gene 80 protein [Daldinia childiae]|uniref:Meiotically up-regulated gene 80 protein n=1 Tax=Daldinia childiae TaxID=326645 RepID=UPI001445588F|nr:Meiotically up-regulated gene 80 protein [Daldinia childiae]KAF3059968.1 Meiotically up-regulated gene 80 protein [Daldinia childiae]
MPGGVCAVLDYETELMAEYVADMTVRVILPKSSVSGAFRKFVNQILTSTRLPSTTILLGMNYLAKRVNMLNQSGSFNPNEGQMWKMLTIALLLGSKFLDDNTFQNRSWSDVSGIAVSDLNTMENEWLKHIGWSLYVNLDQSHDYNAWLKSWKEWEENKKFHQIQQQQQQQQQQQSHIAIRERLAPIVTAIHPEPVRQHHALALQSWAQEDIAEHERFNLNARLAHAGTTGYRCREGSWQGSYCNPWSQPQAPLTPPDSGYGTPEYLNSAASVNASYDEWFSQAVNGGYNRHYKPPGYKAPGHNAFASRSGSHFPQHYCSQYGSGPWDPSFPECCTHCRAQRHGTGTAYV